MAKGFTIEVKGLKALQKKNRKDTGKREAGNRFFDGTSGKRLCE